MPSTTMFSKGGAIGLCFFAGERPLHGGGGGEQRLSDGVEAQQKPKHLSCFHVFPGERAFRSKQIPITIGLG